MNKRWAAPIAITVLAGAVRLSGLGAQCFWGDEICSILVSKFQLPASLGYYMQDPHPPLFYMSVRLMRQLGESELWLRLLPAMWGILAVPVLYTAVNRLHGMASASVAALALAVNPLHYWISQDLRNLSMLTTLCLLSVLLMIPMARGERTKLRWSHSLVTAAALYTNYFSFFIVAFQAVYLLWRTRSPRALKHIIVPVLLFLPWTLFLALQFIHGQSWRSFIPMWQMTMETWLVWTVNAFPWRYTTFVQPLDHLYTTDTKTFFLVQLALTIPALILVLMCAIPRSTEKTKLFAAYLLIPTALVLVTSVLVPIFHMKYMVVVVPAFAACIGIGFINLWNRNRVVAASCLGIMLALNCWSILQVKTDARYVKPPWRGVFADLAQRIEPEHIVLTYNKVSAPDPVHYYDLGAPFEEIKHAEAVNAPIGRKGFAKRLEPMVRGKSTVWMIDYLNHLHDPQRIVHEILAHWYEPGEPVQVHEFMAMSITPYREPAADDADYKNLGSRDEQ